MKAFLTRNVSNTSQKPMNHGDASKHYRQPHKLIPNSYGLTLNTITLSSPESLVSTASQKDKLNTHLLSAWPTK